MLNRQRATSLWVLICIGLSNPGWAQDSVYKTATGGLSFVGKVREGSHITIEIALKSGKKVYSDSFDADVNTIDAEFLDVNRDGYLDVFVKLRDESGFSPKVLLNERNKLFVNGLRAVKEGVYVQAEATVQPDGSIPEGGCQFLASAMRCTNTLIGATGYREVVFRYDTKTISYELSEMRGAFGVIGE